MTRFEDTLLEDLMDRHGAALHDAPATPVVRRGPRRVLVAAAAVLGLAGAVTVVSGVTGPGTPAWAVTPSDDGSVVVSISDIAAIAPANAELQELGVHAEAVPMTTDCTPLDSSPAYEGDYRFPEELSDGKSFRVYPDVPEGYTVLLAVSNYPGGGGLSFSGAFQNAPDCFLDPRFDPSMQDGS